MFQYYAKDKVFGFEKSSNEEVQFSVADRRGTPFADIRVYQIQEDGSKVATHKGIFVSFEKLSAFREGIDRLLEYQKPVKGAKK